MSQVIVTICHSNKHIDLALPIDVPSQVLARAIANALGIAAPPQQSFSLAIRAGKDIRQIAPTQTLLNADVMYGDILELSAGGMMPAPRGLAEAGALLKSDSGMVFPLNNLCTLIGRRAPGVNADVDLTPLDKSRVVHRRHATIERKGDQYVLVDEGGANGTWLNGQRLPSHQSQMLRDGDSIALGGSRGVGLKFVLKS
jgi:hypothetical protein